MEYQLRRYQIMSGKMQEFTDLWREAVVPLRRSFGFEVHGAWTVEASNEFVWIISHDHPDGFATPDRAYYDSPERAALEPDPAQYIEAGDQVLMTRVL